MANPFLGRHASTTYYTGPGPHNVALTIPAGTKGIVVSVHGTNDEPVSFVLGGLTLTKYGYKIGSNCGVGQWGRTSIAGRSNDTLVISLGSSARIVRINVDYFGGGTVAFGTWVGTGSGNPPYSIAVPGGSAEGDYFGCLAYGMQISGSTAPSGFLPTSPAYLQGANGPSSLYGIVWGKYVTATTSWGHTVNGSFIFQLTSVLPVYLSAIDSAAQNSQPILIG